MKKFLILLLMAGFPFIVLFSQTPAKNQPFDPSLFKTHNQTGPATYKSDSSWEYKWNDTTAVWLKTNRNFFQHDQKKRLTRASRMEWVKSLSEWRNSSETAYEYFENDSVSKYTNYLWNHFDNAWVDTYHEYYNEDRTPSEELTLYYNTQNNTFFGGFLYNYNYSPDKTVISGQVFDVPTLSWINDMRDTITYDSGGKILSNTIVQWINNAWMNAFREQYEYDTHGYLIRIIGHQWNPALNGWVYGQKIEYTNNSSGWVIAETLSYWNSGPMDWVNLRMTTYQYDQTGNRIQELYQTWNSLTTSWDNEHKILRSYYEDKKAKEFFDYLWLPNQAIYMETEYSRRDSTGIYLEQRNRSINIPTAKYTSGTRYIYVYENGFHASTQMNDWDSSLEDWVDFKRFSYQYDHDVLSSYLIETFSNGVWGNAYKVQYFNTSYDGISEIRAENWCIFKNPLSPGETINCPGMDQSGNLTVRIFNISGQIIDQSTYNPHQNIKIPGHLSSGMYILAVTDDKSRTVSGKIIVQ